MPFTRSIIAAIALAALPALASASSSDAWDAFAKDVAEKCQAATKDTFRRATVAVDPTGSESFGLAIVHGRLKASKTRAAVICVMDKKTGKVEIGSELNPDQVRIAPPKPDVDADSNAKTPAPKKTKAGDAAGQD